MFQDKIFILNDSSWIRLVLATGKLLEVAALADDLLIVARVGKAIVQRVKPAADNVVGVPGTTARVVAVGIAAAWVGVVGDWTVRQSRLARASRTRREID